METKRYEVKTECVVSNCTIYDIRDTENNKTVGCFFESGFRDAKTWAEWVCEQLNEDVKV